MSAERITIVGGGLAGLMLGIALRRQSVPVTVHEAGSYPRHRVCGELISGRGQQVLERTGLRACLLAAGASEARTGAFYFGSRCTPVRPLPRPALCLSRFQLDALLAQKFTRLGGELVLHSRWRAEADGPGIVWACGREAVAREGGWHWFGLKLHARNVPLAADLEIHAAGRGYVGLCRLPGGEVNVCGLFRAPAGRPDRPAGPTGRNLLRGESGTFLAARLASAVYDESSYCAVGGLALAPQRATEKPKCCVGDALTMTPPVTGNGMSMAFEAAELAAGPLTRYSAGECSWPAARRQIAEVCEQAFARRLTWARRLHRLMFSRWLRTRPGQLLLGSDWLWNWLFSHTR